MTTIENSRADALTDDDVLNLFSEAVGHPHATNWKNLETWGRFFRYDDLIKATRILLAASPPDQPAGAPIGGLTQPKIYEIAERFSRTDVDVCATFSPSELIAFVRFIEQEIEKPRGSQSAPSPADERAAEPTACKGKNCGSLDPRFHSAECFEEHEKTTGLKPAQAGAREGLTDEQIDAIWDSVPSGDLNANSLVDLATLRRRYARALLAAHPGQPEPWAEVATSRCFRCGHAAHGGLCVNVHPDLDSPSLTNPLTPYGILVRALRIVAGITLMDMATALLTTPAKLSAMEFGRTPVTPEFAFDVSAYFDALGVSYTASALRAAIEAPSIFQRQEKS